MYAILKQNLKKKLCVGHIKLLNLTIKTFKYFTRILNIHRKWLNIEMPIRIEWLILINEFDCDNFKNKENVWSKKICLKNLIKVQENLEITLFIGKILN